MFDAIIGGIHCKISLLFPAVLLILLLTDTSGVSAFGFLAAVIHECGHFTALLLFRQKPDSITVSVFGMRMVLSGGCHLGTLQSVAVYVAGPLVNVLCAGSLLLLRVPMIYVWIHLLLAAVNSLPVMPLDGGQVAYTLLVRLVDHNTAARAIGLLQGVLSGALVLFGAAVWQFSGYNFTLFALAIYITLLGLFYKTD